MKKETKDKIKMWIGFLYKPAMFLAGWTKNKVDDILIPVLKSALDKILTTKK